MELQTAVDELVFEARPGKRLQLGISIGAAVFPHDGNTYETLLATADSRMYRDKTKRKRASTPRSAESPEPESRQPISESQLNRAASGVL
jgi:predicted signal transduction protein with EAL and GGDEF domain